MDRAMIEAMKPGKQLDALIAVHVMGWIPVKGDYWPGAARELAGKFGCEIEEAEGWAFPYPGGNKMPDGKEYCSTSRSRFQPSLSIETAWKVVEKIACGNGVEFSTQRTHFVEGYSMAWGAFFSSREKGEIARAFAPKAPEAICKAALLALV